MWRWIRDGIVFSRRIHALAVRSVIRNMAGANGECAVCHGGVTKKITIAKGEASEFQLLHGFQLQSHRKNSK